MTKFTKIVKEKKDVNDITNINSNSGSFDFLADEPEIYSIFDLHKKYV